ncbi:MAG: hypothetical protein RLY71_1049, partial [Pseudomonadota bacterium]
MIDLVINFALIVLASAAACLLLLLTTRLHGRHSMDH